MTLQPGCRFAVAPRFHLPDSWSERLAVGASAGTPEGAFAPHPPWRPPTPEELTLLVNDAAVPAEGGTDEEVGLFRLPDHLGSEWWELLTAGAEALGKGPLPGFDTFAGHVAEFLAFKGLPLPEGARCDVVVSDPARGFVPWGPRPWGAINLGDEPTAVALVNLTICQMGAELRRRFPDEPMPPDAALASVFLTRCPEYPPIRLILLPGEGCRLPHAGLIVCGDPAAKREPDLLLLISYDGPA